MPRPKVAPSVLADRGVPLTLVDGHKVTLCFSFAALLLLEEEFGSVQGVIDKVSDTANAAAFTSILRVLACGLCHEHGPGGEDLADVHNLAALADPGDLATYSDAIGEAFTKAFPHKDDDEAGAGDGEDADPNSPGASGTGSPASTSA